MALVLLLTATSACGGSAQAKNVVDPCAVFTATEASSLLGVSLAKGLPTGTGKGCQYHPAAREDRASGTSLLVTIDEKATPASFAETRRIAGEISPAEDVEDLASVGDGAFLVSIDRPSSHIETADARVGARQVRLLVKGPSADRGRIQAMLIEAVTRLSRP